MADVWLAKLHSWLQGHGGIVSVALLESFGCSRRDAYRLTESGDFEIVMPGILHSTHWPMGEHQLMMAACLRNPHVVVAWLTAARQWKFRGLPAWDEVVVVAPHASSPILPGVVVHRCRRLDHVDIVRRQDGIRLTSPTRTMFDCSDLLGGRKTASILEQLINENKGTFVTHASTVARLAGSSRPGTRTMLAVINSRPAWRAALQSELELLVLHEIQRQGLPTPEVQLALTLPDGRRIRLDFAWPNAKLALEVDHPFWHAGAEESAKDKRRDLIMATIGWQTVRVTDLDVTGGLAAAIRAVAVTLSQR